MVKGSLGTAPDPTSWWDHRGCGHSDYWQPFVQVESSGRDGGQLPVLSEGASTGEADLKPCPGLQRVGSILRVASLEVPGS